MSEAPAINSVWKHSSGQIYKVAALTNMTSTREEYPPTVVYFNVDHDTWWSRPVADWHRSMTEISQ